MKPNRCVYRADDPDWETMDGWKWTPSIHMPRWASRITLEIVSVRAERVNDISEADAQAEGIRKSTDSFISEVQGFINHHTATSAFLELWESINGPGSWIANPWVWCVSFRRTPNAPAHPAPKASGA